MSSIHRADSSPGGKAVSEAGARVIGEVMIVKREGEKRKIWENILAQMASGVRPMSL